MQLAPEACERARLARDRRFDGRFFIGVSTTKIYCRPICPAPAAKPENVRYFPSAAAAHEGGFRPCLRCRPEAAPDSPAWRGTEATVTRALRLIEEGALDHGQVAGLAARLGVGERHLRRLFAEHLGAAPKSVALTRRLHLAKTLLDDTDLPMTEIALAAGFGSVRRFNTALLDAYGRPPSAVRATRRSAHLAGDPGSLTLRLPFREPMDWNGLLGFFAPRAIPGVEAVEPATADGAGTYRRTFRGARDALGYVEVTRCPSSAWLRVRIHATDRRVLPGVVQRLRRQFDLGADPEEIRSHLDRDPRLARMYGACPGLRLPGAFDGFETAVRGILGQQITVRGATTIAGRIVQRCGQPFPTDSRLSHVFPSPGELAGADLARIGIPTARAAAVLGLAQAVAEGRLRLDGTADRDETLARLQELPGIGPWTATYVAMRVLDDPDAFPATDLGLRKALRPGTRVSAAALLEAAEGWRPWRGYAAALLWRSLDSTRSET